MSEVKCENSSAFEYDNFVSVCRKHGLRVTPQRVEIFRQMRSSGDHLCAEELFRRVRQVFPRISFDTVHRTLQTFAAVGLARVVEGTGIPRRFDADISPHHHFWCTRCHRLIDVPTNRLPTGMIPPMLSGRHRVLSARWVMEGVCSDCAGEPVKISSPRLDGGPEVC